MNETTVFPDPRPKPGAEAETTAQFDLVLEENVMVPMRDGVRLATDIYRPARRGTAIEAAFPVILERTPYGKAATSRGEIDHGAPAPMGRRDVARYFVERGYVVLYQDCRGRGASEGEFVKYLAEGADGVDTIAWIRQQPWCNGRVGMMGLSYAAHTQLAPACYAPEGLAALVVDCGGFSSGYHSGMRQGGALELRQATWAFTHAKESPAARSDPALSAALAAEDIAAWFKDLPWKPGHSPLKWVPEYEDYLFEQWTRGTFGDYWKANGIYARGFYPQLSRIPQIHLSGWYDTYSMTAVENYLGVRSQHNAAVELIMGPWLHGDRALTHAGDVEFGAAAALDGNLAAHWRELRLKWFDRWLKAESAEPATAGAEVKLFVMGGGPCDRDAAGHLRHGGRWIACRNWPPEGSVETSLYLDAEGGLSMAAPAGEGTSLSYQFNPKRPVPTIGGAFSSGAPIFYPGAFDQRESERFFGSSDPGTPLAARNDVLVFQTAPLAEDLVIAGPVSVELWISSDCLDTDFTAKLIDDHPPSADYPQGFAMNLTDGILRCRYRDSWERPELLQPGEVCRIMIDLPPIANLFKAGHRLRLDISSSNFPKFDVNPNSGEPEASADLPRIATNSVHSGAARPSRLIVRTLDTGLLGALCLA